MPRRGTQIRKVMSIPVAQQNMAAGLLQARDSSFTFQHTRRLWTRIYLRPSLLLLNQNDHTGTWSLLTELLAATAFHTTRP